MFKICSRYFSTHLIWLQHYSEWLWTMIKKCHFDFKSSAISMTTELHLTVDSGGFSDRYTIQDSDPTFKNKSAISILAGWSTSSS